MDTAPNRHCLREMTLNLEGTTSITDLQDRLREAAKSVKAGETIYGRGWMATYTSP